MDHGPWTVGYYIGEVDGELVIWRMTLRPKRGEEIPQGGLPARLVRELQPGAALAEARRRLTSSTRPDDGTALMAAARRATRRPGRRGQADEVYAAIALEYVKAHRGGSRRPVADATDALRAAGLHYDERYVRSALHKARRRGLLTPTGPGRPGGELTDKAKELAFEQTQWWETEQGGEGDD